MELSEQVEYLSECLSVALELAPALDDDEREQLAELHPFATPYWLDALVATSRSQPTQDVQLIAQLTQKLQQQAERERALIAELEAERQQSAANAAAAAVANEAARAAADAANAVAARSDPARARPLSPRRSKEQLQQQQQQQPDRPGSPRSSSGGGSTPRNGTPQRPPRAQPLGAQQQQQQQQQRRAPSNGAAAEEQPPAAAKRQKAKAPSPEASEDGEDARSSGGGSNGGGSNGGGDDSRAGSSIPWSEFAGDDDGGVIEPADAEEAAEMHRRRQERGESRFDSISEELKALNAGLISEPSAGPAEDNRQPCPNCGRKFLADRLQRHVKVCEDLKRGKEWRGTWKSPSAGGGSRNQLLVAGRDSGSSFKV